ncbi:Major facilitator superfamily domain, general substrate transporter [Niveomyces insectorum RCEF 264]|uniref:Major facilitator superfamily domain, general substrate transporter n=1 Tax=Niveomyces insectorum RCEF 264 TaxID=1081102 RepID=A0A167Z1C7_9HYPO|nr:Major facilitator superfamily domain, general substrate transporter [Niveomyces insectorum RCEF 264]
MPHSAMVEEGNEKPVSSDQDDASLTAHLKKRDGVVLMPQPSDDPADPLNWSWFRKHAAMFTISYLALVCYMAVTSLVAATVPLAVSLGVPKSKAVYLGNTPVALYGVAPFFWSPLSHFIGRRPVLLMCNIIAMVGAGVVTSAKSYGVCMAGRVILGFGGSAFWTLGPASIGDIFFRHEKGKKVGISTLAIVVSPFLGTLVGGAITENKSLGWPATQWILLIFMGVGLIMQIFFLPETIYVRAVPGTQTLPAPGSSDASVSAPAPVPAAAAAPPVVKERATLWDLYGIHIPKRSSNHHTFLFIFTRPFVLLKFPAVLLSAFWFGIAYMMHVGITSEIPLIFEAQYNFSVLDVGLSGLSGLIGALIGEAYAGPSIDFLARRALKQGKEWRPEYRLKVIWPALIAAPGGLIMFGTSLQFGHSWVTPLVGQAIYIFGIEIATTIIQTYILESYPRQGAEASLVFNLIRNVFSYVSPFFLQPMIAKTGYAAPYGLFGALTVFFFPFTVAVLMWRGKEIRERGGDPGWSRD